MVGRDGATPPCSPVGDEGSPDAGQATTEWLMIAGVFTAFVLLLYRLVPAAIRTYSTELIYSIKGIGP